MEFRENPNITAGRYFETNNGHLILNTTSPFDRDHSRQYRVRISEENIIKYNNDGTMDILGNNNSTIFDAPNELVDKIIRDCAEFQNEVTNDNYEEALGHPNLDTMPTKSPQTIPSHISITQYTPSCSKEVPKNVNFNPRVTFANKSNRSFKPSHLPSEVPTVDAKKSAEKTTYCRPMFNLYSQQFIHKTMQRNARLQRLVQKLVLARQRERQDTWNNYINELKNKHRYDSPQPIRIPTNWIEERDRPEFIDDYYNTRFMCGKSNRCHNLLHDFYGASGNMQSFTHNNNSCNAFDNNMSHYMSNLYDNDPYCYPMSSQGRLMMLQKEKNRVRNDFAYELKPRPNTRFYRNNTIIADKEGRWSKRRRSSSIRESEANGNETEEEAGKMKMNDKEASKTSESTQTELKICCIRGDCPGINIEAATEVCTEPQTAKEELEKVSDNVSKLKKKIKEKEGKQKEKSLSGIEGKLDTLIKSMNSFVNNMKKKDNVGHMSKSTSVCECIDLDSNANSSSDMNGYDKEKQIFYSMGARSASVFSNFSHRKHPDSFSKIDKILHEEMDKSNKIKRDIESLLKVRNDRPCSVHISFDIPTRERSTEVTNSLSKTRLEASDSVEEIGPSVASNSEKHMTIAVNTDPLGLLALLRVSTETMKQMLSYMPNIDCYSYLSMFQLPQLSPRGVSHYTCNICGAAFRRPSQLSNHIQEHNLGNTRDCCVCRHALETRQKRTGLYSCQYCGQRFTRAYCCELHQQSCATRLGKRHDVTSSLMLLK